MLSKTCKTCAESLPLTSFTPHKRYAGGVLPHCKPCTNSKRSRVGDRKSAAYAREYYRNNREAINSKRRANKVKNRSYASKKRASLNNATPVWLNGSQQAKIQRTYKLACFMQEITGVDYHVDHIVPLRGKNICGLHVPWNLQVLRADLNLKKSNHHTDGTSTLNSL